MLEQIHEREMERDKAEAELRTSEENYRAIFDAAKDKADRLFWVEVNMRRAVIGGQNRLLVVVRDISERKMAEQALAEQYRAFERHLMDSNKKEIGIISQYIDENGNKEWWRNSKIPLYDQEGNSIGLVGFRQNITEIKKSEEDVLKLNEEKERSADRLWFVKTPAQPYK